ncbi:hypothetical protein NE237_016886 [Protea cynaroides]|uniref:Uncharacterized protein n=1 Tax=Protea cynaroides TaxID=273540 RepID=A0A9Q0HIQ4_9MAGN|nr:hypothetical protein NE237_016886 [Protea cynaroides]
MARLEAELLAKKKRADDLVLEQARLNTELATEQKKSDDAISEKTHLETDLKALRKAKKEANRAEGMAVEAAQDSVVSETTLGNQEVGVPKSTQVEATLEYFNKVQCLKEEIAKLSRLDCEERRLCLSTELNMEIMAEKLVKDEETLANLMGCLRAKVYYDDPYLSLDVIYQTVS